jgi:hypothetical protein
MRGVVQKNERFIELKFEMKNPYDRFTLNV